METNPKEVSQSTLSLSRTAIGSAPIPTASVSSRQPVVNPDQAIDQTASVCNVCRNLVLGEDDFLVKTRSLESSSRLGCQSCLLLATILEMYGASGQDRPINLFYEGNSTLKIHSSDDQGNFVWLDVYTIQNITCQWPSIKAGHHRGCFGSSDASIAAEQIKQWLADCTGTHEEDVCQDSSTLQPLPTRILDIQGPQKVRLYTPSPEKRALYACLSHCWGGLETFKSTRETVKSFHDGIEWGLLPRTFQDALEVTWRLGLTYLWIDSLCIIQGDDKDWRHEGSKMASIYSRSYVTLAATNSPNANGGLYTGKLSTMSTLNPPPSGQIRGFPNMFTRKSMEHDSLNVGNLPLMTRAWAFQERILSPRIVHFTDEELYWECTTMPTCECAVYAPWRSLKFHRSSDSKWLRNDPPAVSIASQEVSRVYNLRYDWYTIVNDYSRLVLTFQTDIFPALQGIVKRMQAIRNCSYYAGIWEDSIAQDLLWYYGRPSPSRPQTSIYRAPSWSWASRASPWRQVAWIRNALSVNSAISVISISTKPVGDDPTGQISAGELILRGRCRKATVIHYHDNHRRPKNRIVASSKEPVYVEDIYMDTQLPHSVEVLLLLIGTFKSRLSSGEFVYSLVLRLVDDDSKAFKPFTYERIGVFWAHVSAREKSLFHNAEEFTIRII